MANGNHLTVRKHATFSLSASFMPVRVKLALDVVVRAFTIVAVSVWLLPVVACGKSPYSLKFVDLTLADQIEVTTDKITIVTDKKQIDAAAQFFNRHRDG